MSTLNAIRVLVAVGLLVLFFAGGEPRVFGEQKPALFSATAAGYLVFAVVSIMLLYKRWLPLGVQSVTQSIVDIVAIVILMNASGGIESGLGGLLIIFIGAGSLVMPLRYPDGAGSACHFWHCWASNSIRNLATTISRQTIRPRAL